MKKALFVISFLCIFSVSSCTNEESEVGNNPTDSRSEFASFDNDPTIIQLSSLNDSLMAVDPSTRGLWSFFKKVCRIAYADIKGAHEGFDFGGTFFGSVGSMIGSVVMGIGSSINAGKKEFTKAVSTISQYDIEAAYTFTVCDSSFERKKSLEGKRVKVNIPKEHIAAVDLAKIHNLTLKTLQTEDFSKANIEDGFTSEEIRILHSPEFQNKYADYISDSFSYDLDFAVSDPNSKEDRILQLFLDLYKNYPNDIEDVNYIINEYISIIEQDNLITSDEKQAVYIAIAVAGYSTDYWERELNQ